LEEQNRETSRLTADEVQRPFDLRQAPLLRAHLLELNDAEHILIIGTHHIVSDAWSMGILTKELWSLYNAFADNKPSPLQDLVIQYGDFAVWQRNWLQGDVLQAQLSYWKKQLNGISILNLPMDRTRPPKQSFRGARHRVIIESELTNAINEFSHNEGVTPFMTLLTAFQVLLSRYSGQEDVIVGSPVANRGGTEIDSLIGFFVNTLVLRADLSGNPTFREALAYVREVCLGAYAHQNLPFEKLVDDLKIERDQIRNPLFEVMFALQNSTRPFGGIPGLQIEPIEVESERSIFDLSLFLREREGRYIGYIEYSTDLFNRDRIGRMAGHLNTLLEGIVSNPDCRIAELPILVEAERHQLLIEWNDTAADYPRDKCIHGLFEEQVKRTPYLIAVEFDGQCLTYQELNCRANQLADYLIGLGVGSEKLVGTCIERSLDMIVGLLGILKAGGAYVPLDPAYPQERLQFMLEDAKCSVVLTQEQLLNDGKLGLDSNECEYVCLDRDWPMIAQTNEDNSTAQVSANNLAYVIYTSGSTGQPKGVAIEHRNTVNLLAWAKTVYGPDELRGVLASTSICFDLSVFEIFLPLICGGKIILAENALAIRDLASKREITLVNTVPSVMAQILALGPLPESLSVVNLAGEPLKAELVKRLYEESRVAKVYDLYGPSETTTYSTFTLRDLNGPETIGRPIANTQIHILDGNLQPVPVGVEGEIYIGGAGVARGYLNRAASTAERFVGSPFGEYPDARLYRTGDRARYRHDGRIELLGRIDHQIKIRGYRIELGEIEVALNQHPGVKESVTLACDHESAGTKQLVAYFVPTGVSVPSGGELRDFLRAKLPDYMIPSSFVVLESFPLLPNGKVDRNRLTPPDGARSCLTKEFASPRTEIEELIAQTWREVLRIENIGIYDNFFELGGNSLLATQIIARLQEAFNKAVPLRVLFDAPTIAGLAKEIETIIRDGHAPELPPIVPVPRRLPLPLSLNQEHLWRLDQMMRGTSFFNMPYVWRLSGDLNIKVLEKALREIIQRHEALRTVFANVNGCPVQIVKEGSDLLLPVEDLRSVEPQQVSQKAATLILEERDRPFDLATGPLLRTKLLWLIGTEYLLLLTMHHIVSDQWSMRVFRSELATLYETFYEGHSSALACPPIQFADYAYWERRSLESGLFDDQLNYWKKQLAGSLARLEFKNSGKRKRQHSFGTFRLPLELDEVLFAAVKALARNENCTPFTVLLTALNILLYLNTGQTDIRIGTLVANRTRKETERVIGYFMNTVILRTKVCPEMTVKEIVRSVRDGAVEAYLHQDLAYEHLARLCEDRKLARDSLCQVLVNYQTFISLPQHFAGLTFAPWDLSYGSDVAELTPTTFDLIFSFRETSRTLTGTVNYRTNTFGKSNITAMIEAFRELLKRIVMSPIELISTVSADIKTQCF
jgi:amino acid adenylation domain-containing protein